VGENVLKAHWIAIRAYGLPLGPIRLPAVSLLKPCQSPSLIGSSGSMAPQLATRHDTMHGGPNHGAHIGFGVRIGRAHCGLANKLI
jgi:hypothetical protein